MKLHSWQCYSEYKINNIPFQAYVQDNYYKRIKNKFHPEVLKL
jgi:hypothetical protein